LEWESPLFTHSDIKGLISFLEKFVPSKINPRTLQRSIMNFPSELPILSDPASNDPRIEKIIRQRFVDSLPSTLLPSEQIYAWALWPAWFENEGFSQVLVVTGSRLLILSDADLHPLVTSNIPLTQIATLEYVGSILNSHIELSLVESGKVRTIKLRFPYSADGAFHRCFEAMRCCMAVLPLID
jgi:hypothetical protein